MPKTLSFTASSNPPIARCFPEHRRYAHISALDLCEYLAVHLVHKLSADVKPKSASLQVFCVCTSPKAFKDVRQIRKERYQEVVDLVRFGKAKLNIFTEKEYYEGHIDPANGADWNQTAPIDTKPTLEDFKKTVSDYLAWEVSTLLKNQDNEDESLGK